MPIAALIASLFGPAVDLVKKLIGKEEDQTKAIAELQAVQAKIVDTVVELEKQKYELMKTESSSANFITNSWRPIASLLIVIVIVISSFGLIHPDEHFWNLAEAFLGIYIGGRSGEKIVGAVMSKVGKK